MTNNNKDNHIEAALNDIKQLMSNDSLDKVNMDILDLTNPIFETEEKQIHKKKLVEKISSDNKNNINISNKLELDGIDKNIDDISNDSVSNHKVAKKEAYEFLLENLVKELLKPELQRWIEINLPNMVKEIIEKNIQDIIKKYE